MQTVISGFVVVDGVTAENAASAPDFGRLVKFYPEEGVAKARKAAILKARGELADLNLVQVVPAQLTVGELKQVDGAEQT